MSRFLLASSFGFCLLALAVTGIKAGISPAKTESGRGDMINPGVGPGHEENTEARAEILHKAPCESHCLCPAVYAPVCGIDPNSNPPSYKKYGNSCELNCDKMQCKPDLRCIDGNKNSLCPAEPAPGYSPCPTS